MAGDTVFPAYIRAEYVEGSGFRAFETAMNDSIRGVKQRFDAEFREINSIITGSLRRASEGAQGLDFGADAIRRSAAEARFKADALKITADAARSLAAAEGDASEQTARFVAASRAAAIEAERVANAAANEASALLKLEQATQAAVAGNDKLAASYRALFAEQIKAANAEVAARAAQDRINNTVSPGLTRGPATANGAGYEALAQLVKDQANEEALLAKQLAEHQAAEQRLVAAMQQRSAAMDDLRRAEAGAVNGGAMLQAIYRGTAEEAGRVAISARESARAFEESAAAQEKAAMAAARAEQQLADAVAALRAQLDPMIPAQNRFNAAMDQADNLFQQGAITAREYAAAQQLARSALQAEAQQIAGTAAATEQLNREQRRGTTATQAVTNSLGAQRFAMIQAGQQLQDITVSLASGQRAAVVFAQQLPQLAFVMSDFGGRVGQVARFLAGPWGFAIFGAITVAGLFADSLFGASDASKQAERSTIDFSNTLDARRASVVAYADAVDQLEQATRSLINTQSLMIDNTLAAAQSSVASLQTQIADVNRKIGEAERRQRGPIASAVFGNDLLGQAEIAQLRRERNELGAQLRAAMSAEANARTAFETRRAAEGADPREAERASIARERARLQERRAYTLQNERGVPLQDGISLATISEAEFQRQLATLERRERALSERPRRPRRGPSAQTLANRAFRRNEFGDDTERRLADIAGQFSTVPPAIAQTERALRQVEDLRNDIMFKANPSERDGLIAELERVKALVEGSIADDFRETLRLGEQDLAIHALRTQGMDDQAEALQLQFDLMRQFGAVNEQQLAIELNRRGITADEYQARLNQLAVMQEMTREARRLDRAGTSARAQLQAVDDIRTNIEQNLIRLDIGSFVRNLRDQMQDLFARSTVESLFGQTFADLEAEISNNPRARADRAVAEQSSQVTDAMRELEAATRAAAAAVAGTPAANDNAVDGGEIPVLGRRSVATTDPINIIQLTFTRLFERFLGAGSPLANDLGAIVKDGLQGVAIGQTAAGLVFGSKASNTGAGIGGAIGNVLGKQLGKQFGQALGQLGQFAGPAGAIVGSLLGSALGGVLRKTKTGVANIGGSSSGGLTIASYSGNSTKFREAAGKGGDSVLSTVDRIAEALGATVNGSAGSVSIGIRDGKYRVDPTGGGATKLKKGAIDFGDDAEAAIRYATMDLIKDGVLGGLRASTLRLVQNAKDLDAGLQKALDFESVFTRLKTYKDPVGAALDALDKEFTRLKKIFDEAGASTEEYAQLEELYGIERAKAIKEAGERTVASLKGLFDDLTVGNDALSLRQRLGLAKGKYDPLAQRVAAGDTSAYDDFAAAARELLDIQRQISGSGSDYFNLLDQITALTKTRIDAETNIASIAANRDSPFDSNGNPTNAVNDNTAVVAAIDNQTQALLDGMSGLGADIIRAAIYGGSSGTIVGGAPGAYAAQPF